MMSKLDISATITRNKNNSLDTDIFPLDEKKSRVFHTRLVVLNPVTFRPVVNVITVNLSQGLFDTAPKVSTGWSKIIVFCGMEMVDSLSFRVEILILKKDGIKSTS